MDAPARNLRRIGLLGVALLLVVAIALLAALPSEAKPNPGGGKGDGASGLVAGDPLLPPKGKIYTGASDTGQTSDYREFHKGTGAHPAVMQSFESWGYVPKEALGRWSDTNTRGMLSLSTSPAGMQGDHQPAEHRQRQGRLLHAHARCRSRQAPQADLHPAPAGDERLLEPL